MNKRDRAIIILVTVLTLLLVGFAVFMLVKEYLTDGKIEKRALLCAIFIVISAIGTLVKLFTNKKPSRNSVQIYRNEYGKIIGDAFSDNKSKEKLFFKGVHEWNHSRFNSAVSIFNGMLKDASTGTEKFALLFFLALCYDEMKVYDLAIRLYEEALLIKDNSSAASNLGICYEHIGAPEKATEAYERAIYSDPENPFSYNNLAQSLVRQGRYEDAIPWAKEAIKRKANIYQAHTALAICFAMLGDKEEYEKEYRLSVSYGANGPQLRGFINSLLEPESNDESEDGTIADED